jgi:Aspartyl/Asparaginyl beta-hydroxylase
MTRTVTAPATTPASTSAVCARLPLRFDVDRLVDAYHRTRELYALATHVAGHDGRSYHDGWQGVSLRSNGGEWRFAGPGRPSPAPFRDTEVVDRVPFWREVLDAFRCDKESVRVSVLAAGGTITPHCDEHVGFAFGRLRLHIPMVTSDAVVMEIGGQRCDWQPGELWFGDFRHVHTVVNRGAAARAHLLLDVQVNDWVLGLFSPEFLAHQPVARFPELCPATPQELAHCQCAFAIPAESPAAGELLDALLPAAREQVERAVPPLRARLVAIDDTLTLELNGVPVFALEPLAHHRFRLCGWPLRFELRLARRASGITAVSLGDGETTTTWEARDGA